MYKSDFLDPKAVKVAVCVNREGLLTCELELYLGGISRLKTLALSSAVGHKVYPLDQVLLRHRMKDRADDYLHGITLDRYLGDMLLQACFNRAGYELGHFLAAADYGNTRIVYLSYNILPFFQ